MARSVNCLSIYSKTSKQKKSDDQFIHILITVINVKFEQQKIKRIEYLQKVIKAINSASYFLWYLYL